MSKRIIIPITDHDDNCTSKYLVEYKLQSETGYVALPPQFTGSITINNLQEDSMYDVRITRYCCDDNTGVTNLAVDTTNESDQLDAPTGLVLTGYANSVNMDWDAVTDATNYHVQRADDADFIINLVEGSVSGGTDYLFDSLVDGQNYYFRVRARADGFVDSNWTSGNHTAGV